MSGTVYITGLGKDERIGMGETKLGQMMGKRNWMITDGRFLWDKPKGGIHYFYSYSTD